MRQYYDVYCLLGSPEVIEFIGSEEYLALKEKRFPTVDFEIPISKNEAFLLSSPEIRADFTARYKTTAALYYLGQPPFNKLIERIAKHIKKM